MNRNIARLWADALTSGEFVQGRWFLASRHYRSQGPYEHCVGGVLCELATRVGVVDAHPSAIGEYNVITYGTGHGVLSHSSIPKEVLAWANIAPCTRASARTAQLITDYNGSTHPMSVLNDMGFLTFAQFADMIRNGRVLGLSDDDIHMNNCTHQDHSPDITY